MSAETGREPIEEPAAERQAERRRRARVDRADALPRALDGEPDGRVEHAAAGDLEVREAGRVEDLGDAEHLTGRELARERILREQADGGVDDLGHVECVDLIVARDAGERLKPRRAQDAASPPSVTRARCSGLRAGRP